MKFKRSYMYIILILCLVIATSIITQGSADAVEEIRNVYENSLSEENAGKYFDLSRGLPKYSFHKEDNKEIIELSRGILHSRNELGNVFTFTVNIRLSGDNVQCSIEFGRKSGQPQSTVITLNEGNNNIGIVSGANKQYNLDYTGKFRPGVWYKVTAVAKDDKLHLYIDNKYFTTIINENGFNGGFLFRLGTGDSVQLRDLSVFETTSKVVEEDNSYGELKGFSKYMLPGLVQTYTYIPADFNGENLQMKIKDSKGKVYETQELTAENGEYKFTFIPRGSSGVQTIEFISEEKTSMCEIYLEAITAVQTPDADFNNFFQNQMYTIISRNQRTQNIFGYEFKSHMSWLRDHIHMLKASIYWDEGAKDSISFWVNQQNERGFFYEMIIENNSPGGKSYMSNSDPDFIRAIDKNNSLVRFEIEADIEYMMVEAVYLVWQATGDAEWMKSTLDNLDKGMTWTSTDPERWSKKLGLTIRGSSIDTYDFTYGHNTANRRVVWWEKDMDWGTPMAVFHGDNTGFYQSCKMLSKMYTVVGNSERVKYWDSLGDSVKKNLIDTAWNGSYFAHMVQAYPKFEDLPEDWKEDLGGDWERLSSSNAYALNRGILTQKQASSILDTFLEFRNNPPYVETKEGYSEEKFFAEWVTIYPSYRKKEYMKYDVGTYINGTIASFTAGELSNGAFKYGYEEYGYDILTRLKELYLRDGRIPFYYTQSGEIYKHSDGSDGGPAGWGTATIYNAIIEGLAGFEDRGVEFDNVAISPAFLVTEHDVAYASCSYGSSDKYIAYSMQHNKADDKVTYTIVGDSKNIELKLMVPKGHSPNEVLVNGIAMEFKTVVLKDSVYAVLSYDRASNTDVDTVEVVYKEGVPEVKKPKKDNSVLSLLILQMIAAIAIIATTVFIVKNKKKKAK